MRGGPLFAQTTKGPRTRTKGGTGGGGDRLFRVPDPHALGVAIESIIYIYMQHTHTHTHKDIRAASPLPPSPFFLGRIRYLSAPVLGSNSYLFHLPPPPFALSPIETIPYSPARAPLFHYLPPPPPPLPSPKPPPLPPKRSEQAATPPPPLWGDSRCSLFIQRSPSC